MCMLYIRKILKLSNIRPNIKIITSIRMIKKICYPFIYIILICQCAFGQSNFSALSIYSGYGSVIQHTKKIGNLIVERPFFIESNIFKTASGYYKWHRINHYPDYGLCFNFETLGNTEKLGYSMAIAPYIELPFRSENKAVLFKMKMAWGIAYISKRFDIEQNHKNIAIGTHINTFIQFRFLWQIRVSPHIYINPNFTFIHVSNCRVAVPNLGINTLYPSIGLTYRWREDKRYNTVMDSSADKQSPHEILIFSAIGVNEVEPPTNNKLWAFTTGINYYYNLHQNQQIGIGIDGFYEQSLAYESRSSDTVRVNLNFNNTTSAGIKLCYAYNFGRITPLLEMGYYFFMPHSIYPNGTLYHRLGCRYYFQKNIVAHFSLKTHFGVAYHIEAGIGYRIPLFTLKTKK